MDFNFTTRKGFVLDAEDLCIANEYYKAACTGEYLQDLYKELELSDSTALAIGYKIREEMETYDTSEQEIIEKYFPEFYVETIAEEKMAAKEKRSAEPQAACDHRKVCLDSKEFTNLTDDICSKVIRLITETVSELTGHPSDDMQLIEDIEDVGYGYGILPILRDSVLTMVDQLAKGQEQEILYADCENNLVPLGDEDVYQALSERYGDLAKAVRKISE